MDGLLSALHEALQANLLVDAAVRQAAELRVQQLRSQPGFAMCLAQLALQPQAACLEVRQLAAVVLKHFVQADWPRVPETERATVRTALPAGLRDGQARIRTAVSVVIASVAKHDWPEAWPTLLEDLLQPLEVAGADADTVAGVLRCLEICASDLSAEHMRPALERLLPKLLEVFGNAAGYHSARTRARAIKERVSMMCDDAALLKALQRGPLAAWAAATLAELAAPLAAFDDCSVALALLRLLRLLVEHAPLALKPHGAALLPALGEQLLGAMGAHEARLRAAEAEDDEGACDSDGGSLGLGALAAGLFDLVGALAASSRWSKPLLGALPDLFGAALAFLQLTPAAEAEWEADLAQYLLDEDADSYAVSTRVAAQHLCCELFDWYGRKALGPLCAAVQRRLSEASGAGAAGWRLREAAWLALSLGADTLCDAARRGKGAPPLQPALLLGDARLLLADVAPGAPPLLRGRALCCAARFSADAPPAALAPFLRAAAEALRPCEPPTLRLCACRALAGVCATAPAAALDGAAGALLPLLGALLPDAMRAGAAEAGEPVLGTIAALLRTSPAAAAAAEPTLSPSLLALWAAHWQEPLLADALVAVFEAMADNAALLPALAARLLPALCHVLEQAAAAREAAAARAAADAAADAAAAQRGGAPRRAHAELWQRGGAADAQAADDDEDDVDEDGDGLGAGAWADEDAGAPVDPLEPALRLLDSVLLKRWPKEAPLPEAAHRELLPRLLRVVASSAEPEVTRLGVSCLGRFVRRGALQLAEQHGATRAWLDALSALLRPSLGEACAVHVPPLVALALRHAPALFDAQRSPLPPRVLGALVAWLRAAKLFGLTQACLLLLARLVHAAALGPEWLVGSLAQLEPPPPPAAGGGGAGAAAGAGALPFVLRLWVERQEDVLAPGVAASTLLALVRLVSLPRPELQALPVPAPRAVDAAAPRASRSAARRRGGGGAAPPPEQPLLVRVFQLTARGLLLASMASAGGGGRGRAWDDEDEDEDEDDEDDDDDEEDEDEEEGDEDGGGEAGGGGGGGGGGGAVAGAAARGKSPFVAADEAQSLVNLSDLLDDGADDLDEEDDEEERQDEAAETVDMPAGATEFVRALATHLGANFQHLVAQAALGPDEARVIALALNQTG